MGRTPGRRRDRVPQRRAPRLAVPDVEGARLVSPGSREQRRPVPRTERRPRGDRPDVDARRPGVGRGAPRAEPPGGLVPWIARELDLCEDDRAAIARPGIADRGGERPIAATVDAHELDVRVRDASVAAARLRREALQPVVDPAIAGDVVVDPDPVGRLGVSREVVEDPDRIAVHGEPRAQRVARTHPAGEQVEGQPAPPVAEHHGVPALAGASRPADVLVHEQACVRDDVTHGADRGPDREALREQHPDAGIPASLVRRPQAVHAREPRGRQRLVDRQPVGHPGHALGGCARVRREGGRKRRIQQPARQRPLAVVEEAHDGVDAERAQSFQARHRPRPVRLGRGLPSSTATPQDRIPDPRHAELGEPVDVRVPRLVPRHRELVDEAGGRPHVRALDACPGLERPRVARVSGHATAVTPPARHHPRCADGR